MRWQVFTSAPHVALAGICGFRQGRDKRGSHQELGSGAAAFGAHALSQGDHLAPAPRLAILCMLSAPAPPHASACARNACAADMQVLLVLRMWYRGARAGKHLIVVWACLSCVRKCWSIRRQQKQ